MKPEIFKVSAYDPKPLSWWRAQRSKIDMQPPYQRKGGLWSTADKAFLIDSILNDYDVPKVYLADFSFARSKLNKKKLLFAIVDGKQRFEAIFEFFDGTLRLDENFIYRENRKLKIAGLGYPELRNNYPEVADKFDSFALSVMRIVTDSEDAINELFVRLNRSKPLTGAEVRNAASGPVPRFVRDLIQHEFFTSYVTFPNKRLQHNNAATKLLFFEFHGKPQQTKKQDLDQFVIETRAKKRIVASSGRAVLDVLDELVDVFLPKDKLLANSGLVPDYYWFIRNTSTRDRRFVREFLVAFDRRLRSYQDATSKKGRAPKVKLDATIAAFIGFNRNTNDRGSHDGRIAILTKEFNAYLAAKVPNVPVNNRRVSIG